MPKVKGGKITESDGPTKYQTAVIHAVIDAISDTVDWGQEVAIAEAVLSVPLPIVVP